MARVGNYSKIRRTKERTKKLINRGDHSGAPRLSLEPFRTLLAAERVITLVARVMASSGLPMPTIGA